LQKWGIVQLNKVFIFDFGKHVRIYDEQIT